MIKITRSSIPGYVIRNGLLFVDKCPAFSKWIGTFPGIHWAQVLRDVLLALNIRWAFWQNHEVHFYEYSCSRCIFSGLSPLEVFWSNISKVWLLRKEGGGKESRKSKTYLGDFFSSNVLKIDLGGLEIGKNFKGSFFLFAYKKPGVFGKLFQRWGPRFFKLREVKPGNVWFWCLPSFRSLASILRDVSLTLLATLAHLRFLQFKYDHANRLPDWTNLVVSQLIC